MTCKHRGLLCLMLIAVVRNAFATTRYILGVNPLSVPQAITSSTQEGPYWHSGFAVSFGGSERRNHLTNETLERWPRTATLCAFEPARSDPQKLARRRITYPAVYTFKTVCVDAARRSA